MDENTLYAYGKIVYSSDKARSIKHTLLEAVEKGIDLSGVDLAFEDLTDMDLRGGKFNEARFSSSRLRGSLFDGSEMCRALLTCIDATTASMAKAKLDGADFSYATLRNVSFVGASLRGCRFHNADIAEANFTGADLSGAILSGARAERATFSNAKLNGADLEGTDFVEASLNGADLTNVRYDCRTQGIHPAPEGELIGWGRKQDKDTDRIHIVKLRVPAEAKRSCATTRKFRCEYAEVLDIQPSVERVRTMVQGHEAIYEVGKIVRCHQWDPNRWNECSGGIHFFLTRKEAES